MTKSKWFRGLNAVVTGAGHGIGQGIAFALRDAGATVCGVEIDAARADLLQQNGIDTLVSNIERGADIADEVIGHFGGPPVVVVNNVGLMDGRGVLELPIDDVKCTFEANLFGPWDFTRRLALAAIAAKAPMSILFVLSLHTAKLRMCADYSASKAAAKMLMLELAHVLGPHGIRVNALSPGAVDTWSDSSPDSPAQRARTNSIIPLGRVGEVSDVTGLALTVLDDEASGYVTGTDLVIDGGLGQHNWLHALYGDADQEQRRMSEGEDYDPESKGNSSRTDR